MSSPPLQLGTSKDKKKSKKGSQLHRTTSPRGAGSASSPREGGAQLLHAAVLATGAWEVDGSPRQQQQQSTPLPPPADEPPEPNSVDWMLRSSVTAAPQLSASAGPAVPAPALAPPLAAPAPGRTSRLERSLSASAGRKDQLVQLSSLQFAGPRRLSASRAPAISHVATSTSGSASVSSPASASVSPRSQLVAAAPSLTSSGSTANSPAASGSPMRERPPVPTTAARAIAAASAGRRSSGGGERWEFGGDSDEGSGSALDWEDGPDTARNPKLEVALLGSPRDKPPPPPSTPAPVPVPVLVSSPSGTEGLPGEEAVQVGGKVLRVTRSQRGLDFTGSAMRKSRSADFHDDALTSPPRTHPPSTARPTESPPVPPTSASGSGSGSGPGSGAGSRVGRLGDAEADQRAQSAPRPTSSRESNTGAGPPLENSGSKKKGPLTLPVLGLSSPRSAGPGAIPSSSSGNQGKDKETTKDKLKSFAAGLFGSSSRTPSPHVSSASSAPGSANSSSRASQPGSSGTAADERARVLAPGSCPLFGVPLEELLQRTHLDVPALVPAVLRALAPQLAEEGLFRVSASAAEVNEVRVVLERAHAAALQGRGQEAVQSADEALAGRSPHVAASVLTAFLLELPEPLLTFGLYEDLLSAAATPPSEQRLAQLGQLLGRLPRAHALLLRPLLLLLRDVAAHADRNLMTASNVGIVFGPILLRAKKETLDLRKFQLQSAVCEAIVAHADRIVAFLPESSTQQQQLLRLSTSNGLGRRPSAATSGSGIGSSVGSGISAARPASPLHDPPGASPRSGPATTPPSATL